MADTQTIGTGKQVHTHTHTVPRRLQSSYIRSLGLLYPIFIFPSSFVLLPLIFCLLLPPLPSALPLSSYSLLPLLSSPLPGTSYLLSQFIQPRGLGCTPLDTSHHTSHILVVPPLQPHTSNIVITYHFALVDCVRWGED